jgi:hypothetical protein
MHFIVLVVESVGVRGFAATVLGSPRITIDLDVVYARDRENLARLARVLEPLSPYLRGAPPGLPFRLDVATLERGLNFTLTTSAGDLDLLGEIAGQPFAIVTWSKGLDPKTGRPIETPEARYGTEPVTLAPAPPGAHTWHPMSYHPDAGLAYFPVRLNSYEYARDPNFAYTKGGATAVSVVASLAFRWKRQGDPQRSSWRGIQCRSARAGMWTSPVRRIGNGRNGRRSRLLQRNRRRARRVRCEDRRQTLARRQSRPTPRRRSRISSMAASTSRSRPAAKGAFMPSRSTRPREVQPRAEFDPRVSILRDVVVPRRHDDGERPDAGRMTLDILGGDATIRTNHLDVSIQYRRNGFSPGFASPPPSRRPPFRSIVLIGATLSASHVTRTRSIEYRSRAIRSDCRRIAVA